MIVFADYCTAPKRPNICLGLGVWLLKPERLKKCSVIDLVGEEFVLLYWLC